MLFWISCNVSLWFPLKDSKSVCDVKLFVFFMKFFYSTPLQTRKNASFDLTSNYFQPNFCICFIRLQFYLNFLIASFVFPSRPITEETRLDVMTGSPAGSCVRTRLGTLELIFALRPTSAATQSFKNHPIQAGSVL